MVRPDKKLAEKSAIALAPRYVSLLRDFQKGDGRIVFPAEVTAIHGNVGSYVKLYEDERRIGIALLLAILGEKEFAHWQKELEAASEVEQQAWLDEVVSANEADVESSLDKFCLPTTAQEWAAANELFDGLSDEEKNEETRRASFFWSFFFSSFFNFLSLMVPPCQNSCRLDRTKNVGAMKEERIGTIRAGIQG